MENDKRPPEILEAAAATFRQRNALYGDNYKNFGHIMQAIFPTGLQINSVDDWNRLGIFIHLISKSTRYAANFATGGHKDSAHDSCVYSAMLEELTEELAIGTGQK